MHAENCAANDFFAFSRIKNRLQPIECYEYLKHLREHMRIFKYVKETSRFPSYLPAKIQVEWGEKLPFCQSTPAECEGEKGRAVQRSSGMEGRCLCFHEDRMRSAVPRPKASFWLGAALAFRFFVSRKNRNDGSAVPRFKSKL